MKTSQTLQKKRQAPRSGQRVLHAIIPRKLKKKQRAATATADELDEVPNFGVASALVVILVLHLVAIVAIVLHNKFNGGRDYEQATPAVAQEDAGQINLDSRYEPYVVEEGDTYAIIARKRNVDLEELKKINNGIEPKRGALINLPIASVELARIEEAALPDAQDAEPPIAPNTRPTIQVDEAVIDPSPRPDMAEVTPQGGAVLIRSSSASQQASSVAAVVQEVEEIEEAPRPREEVRAAVAVEEQPKPRPSRKRSHTVRKGETIWRLSRKYGVNQNELMRINGISDPSRVRIGMTLRIPD